MSDEAERIRRQMQHVRQEVGADVKGIVQGARHATDWRYYVQRHPWACLGSAFALGFLVTPARRKLLAGGDAHKVIEQLRSSGLLAAATSAAPLASGGMAAKVLALAGPILLRGAASLIAQHMSAGKSPPEPADVVAP
jgi:hypothetical protein